MMNLSHFVDQLLDKISLHDLIGREVKLTKRGNEYIGLCPFHQEKTPSFHVVSDKQFYHCFGCGAHGDAIRFLMEAHKYTFIEAVKELSRRAGLSLPEESMRNDGSPQEDLTPLRQALQEASLWFHKNLSMAKHGEALRYTERRGLKPATLKKFNLGFAPEGNHSLEKYLKEKGFSEEILLKTGILAQGDTGRAPYERFRKRIMFPIQDAQGRVVAFGGRWCQ